MRAATPGVSARRRAMSSAITRPPAAFRLLQTPHFGKLTIGGEDPDRERLAVAGGAEAQRIAGAALGLDVLEPVIGNDDLRLVAIDGIRRRLLLGCLLRLGANVAPVARRRLISGAEAAEEAVKEPEARCRRRLRNGDAQSQRTSGNQEFRFRKDPHGTPARTNRPGFNVTNKGLMKCVVFATVEHLLPQHTHKELSLLDCCMHGSRPSLLKRSLLLRRLQALDSGRQGIEPFFDAVKSLVHTVEPLVHTVEPFINACQRLGGLSAGNEEIAEAADGNDDGGGKDPGHDRELFTNPPERQRSLAEGRDLVIGGPDDGQNTLKVPTAQRPFLAVPMNRIGTALTEIFSRISHRLNLASKPPPAKQP